MESVEQTTLRDTLDQAFESVASAEQPAAAPESTESKEQRARDDAGRFAKEQANVAPQVPPSTVAKADPSLAPAAAAPSPQRPSSWKKDYWADYDKIATENPKLAEYLNQREREFATGVSTYKAEAENARQINETLAPFMPLIQQHNIQPQQLIGNLLNAHKQLALGSPMEKIQTFSALMNQYGVDPQHLFQMLSGQQPQVSNQPTPQPIDIDRIVESKLTEKEINQEYQRFVKEAPEKYPHFEVVKETMAGLLQAELAQDYASAYEAAIRHPRHADIWEAVQTAQRDANAAADRERANATAKGAKARATSTPSSSPSGASVKLNGKQGLREMLSDAFDTATSSRV